MSIQDSAVNVKDEETKGSIPDGQNGQDVNEASVAPEDPETQPISIVSLSGVKKTRAPRRTRKDL